METLAYLSGAGACVVPWQRRAVPDSDSARRDYGSLGSSGLAACVDCGWLSGKTEAAGTRNKQASPSEFTIAKGPRFLSGSQDDASDLLYLHAFLFFHFL